MHLWPTMRIRESFKISYLKKYDWNLQRMNSEKKRQSQEANDNSNQQRLLDDAERFSWSSLAATVASVLEPVLIKTRNEAVLEGVRPLNLLFEDNISEGGTGIFGTVKYTSILSNLKLKADEWQDGRALP
ncbi:hypothetical protein NC651_019621 [Populus alba x Populus x berolinensis]|nr:hypothetical protein NC651_019621 [Populus alba x Populus x berolinensis]